MRGVEVGDGNGVCESKGVVVCVMVGESVGDGVTVGGISVKAVSGRDNCPEGTQAERNNIDKKKIKFFRILVFISEIIP
jgi:hypothetical protein